MLHPSSHIRGIHPHITHVQRLLGTLGLICALAMGCGGGRGETSQTDAPTNTDSAQEKADKAGDDAPKEAPKTDDAGSKAPAAAGCVPFKPAQEHPELELSDGQPLAQALICPDEKALQAAIDGRDRHEPQQRPTSKNLAKDPIKLQTGIEIYDDAVKKTGKLAWFVPMLFNGTPPMSKEQVELFDQHKRLANEYSEMWQTRGGGTYDPYAWTGGDRWKYFEPVMKRYKSRQKHKLRALLLRKGGVLFVEDAQAASDIYRFLGIHNLFDEEHIWHRRGDAIHRLRRKNKLSYVYDEGPRKDEHTRLLVFDRLATTREGVEGRLGWDLNRLRPMLALKAFQLEDHGEDLLRGKAKMRHGDLLPAAAFEEGGTLKIAVVVPKAEQDKWFEQIKADRASAAIGRGILRAGEKMLAEELPFDEPITEHGQQDGHLRPAWEDAYLRGGWSYNVNGDKYRVFNKDGTPKVPQVCIDFIYDSIERWSGTWYSHKETGREHTNGFIHITPWMGKRKRRQVSQLVQAAADHPERMDLLRYEDSERIQFGDSERFYTRLKKLGDTSQPGDIIAIHGLKNDGRNHWHSFYLYEFDPIYNLPHLVIGNTGRVRIQPWHPVMRTGPKRSIVARIRWKEDWLRKEKAAWEAGKDKAAP